MTVGGDYSISSAFPLTPFKGTTHGFQGFTPGSSGGLLNPFRSLGAQGKISLEYHLQETWKWKIRWRVQNAVPMKQFTRGLF